MLAVIEHEQRPAWSQVTDDACGKRVLRLLPRASSDASWRETRAGSPSDSSGTRYTPSGYRSAIALATYRANHVLPAPPAPVMVSKRVASSSRCTSASSRRQPTNVDIA